MPPVASRNVLEAGAPIAWMFMRCSGWLSGAREPGAPDPAHLKRPGEEQTLWVELKPEKYERRCVLVMGMPVGAKPTNSPSSIRYSPDISGCGISGAWPRLYTIRVRLNVMTTVPSCLYPVVFTVTIPTFGRDFDSRFSSTSDIE